MLRTLYGVVRGVSISVDAQNRAIIAVAPVAAQQAGQARNQAESDTIVYEIDPVVVMRPFDSIISGAKAFVTRKGP